MEVPMSPQHTRQFSRRRFLGGLTLAGTAGLLSLPPRSAAAEPPPETTRIRLIQIPGICQAPQYVAEELLRSEGVTEVHYLKKAGIADIETALASGEADLNGHFAAPLLLRLEAGDPIVILAGLHIGCFELFGTPEVRTIRDLKGKTVAVPALDSSRYVFLASMVAYVGLDPRKDIKALPYRQWHEYSPEDTLRFYALRLHEVGMLKGSPQKLIAQGTDWRFFNELKKELKG